MQNGYQGGSYNNPDGPQMPMKWHKFLIYFALWAAALSHAAEAITYFTGSHYGGNATQVYRVFAGLRIVDIVMAIVSVALGVFCILIRNKLAGYEKEGITWLKINYIVTPVVALIYIMLASLCSGMSATELGLGQWVSSMVTSLVMVVINSTYYNKREHMFY